MFRHRIVLVFFVVAMVMLGACQGLLEDFPQSTDNQIEVNSDGLYVSDTGNITVDKVLSAKPGWLCIRADQNGDPGPIIGCSAVLPEGESQNIPVLLDMASLTWTLHPTLYVDAGTPGVLEVPDPDVPALSAFGSAISIQRILIADPSWVTVSDQPLSGGDTIVVARVYVPVTALLVIHDARDLHVLGFTPLQLGENLNVPVQVEVRGNLDELIVEVHWDGNNIGKLDLNDPAAKVDSGDYLQVNFHVTGK